MPRGGTRDWIAAASRARKISTCYVQKEITDGDKMKVEKKIERNRIEKKKYIYIVSHWSACRMLRDRIFGVLLLRKYVEQRKRKKTSALLLPSIFSMLQSITTERKEVQIDLDSRYYFSPDVFERRAAAAIAIFACCASYCTAEEMVAQENIRPVEKHPV